MASLDDMIPEVLVQYKNWRPSPMDTRGLGLPDRQDWYVGPCARTRDSDPLAESNFRVMVRRLEKARVKHEVHRFGHWGPGWVEIVLVKTRVGARLLADMACSLADYPVLDEMDYSELENEEIYRSFEQWYHGTFSRALQEYVMGDCPLVLNTLDKGDLWELYGKHSLGEHCDYNGATFDDGAALRVTRDEVAALIRRKRAEKRGKAA